MRRAGIPRWNEGPLFPLAQSEVVSPLLREYGYRISACTSEFKGKMRCLKSTPATARKFADWTEPFHFVRSNFQQSKQSETLGFGGTSSIVNNKECINHSGYSAGTVGHCSDFTAIRLQFSPWNVTPQWDCNNSAIHTENIEQDDREETSSRR
jgi:hypothetical protein